MPEIPGILLCLLMEREGFFYDGVETHLVKGGMQIQLLSKYFNIK